MLLIYGIGSFALLQIGHYLPTFVPARGNIAFIADLIIVFCSVGAFLYLNFIVVDATRLCRVFVLNLIEETRWPMRTTRRFAEENSGLSGKHVDPWIDIQVIERVTSVVSQLVWYPFAVLTLLLLARKVILMRGIGPGLWC